MTLGQKHHYPVHPLKKKIRTVTNKATSHGKKRLLDQVFSLWSLKMTIHFFPTSQTLSPDVHMWIPLKSKRPQARLRSLLGGKKVELERQALEQECDVRTRACTWVEDSYQNLKSIFESSSFKSSQPDYPGNPLTSVLQYKSKGDGKVLLRTSAKLINP